MNPNQGPQGPEFKQESLDKKFSYAFTRKQCIILSNALAGLQFAVHDIRGKVLRDILEEIERTAIQSVTSDDYKKTTPPPTQELPHEQQVKVN